MNPVKMRNRKKGIQLKDSIKFRLLYSKNDMTKERIVSMLNNRNNSNFARQSIESKENNIPIDAYSNVFNKISKFFNSFNNIDSQIRRISIDGVYNNDIHMNEILNMGFFDSLTGIPIDLQSFGKENKNNEIRCAVSYIKKHIKVFKNNIIVADRAYFSYDFLNFLIKNDIKFIIRAKWDAKNLDSSVKLNRNAKNYNDILNVRKNTKTIKYTNTTQKKIYASNTKKEIKTYTIQIKNNCTLVTNLLDEETYTDDKILEFYKSRWDIEVFFKYIKSNYKFQHMKEKSKINCQKMYICELIITYIAKLIEKYYMDKHPIDKKLQNVSYKINYSNLINGIFDSIIWEMLDGTLTDELLDKFCKSYIKISQNKTNRSFPRTSKTPFSKWYIKGYSNLTKYMKVIEAILNNKVNELNKNLKTIAKNIISINSKKVNG
jgi:hypothetical protein